MTQHMTTKIRMLRVVFLNILLFRLRFIPRPPRESPCFPATFQSLLFLMIFVSRQNKSLLYPSRGHHARLDWQQLT